MTASDGVLVKSLSVACPLCESSEAREEMARQKYRLVRCGVCGLVYSDRLDIPIGLYDQAYDNHAFYQAYFRQANKARRRRIHIAWAWRQFFRHSTLPGGRLLDIGCATGAFLLAAKNRGWNSLGIDISEAAAEVARDVSGVDVQVGTLEACAFPVDMFDAVTAWEVLEHLADPRSFLKDIYRVLKPGGVVALSTPNWRSPWERKTLDDNRRPPYHLTFWSAGPITRLLLESGFTDVVTREKPVAWTEEVGRFKWAYLPIAIIRSMVFSQKGNRLVVFGRKPDSN